MPTLCVLVERTRACTARPAACLYSPRQRQPCRAVRIASGVAFGSTSLLHTARHGKRASERAGNRRPPGRARRRPCFAPSPVRSRRYGRTGGILLRVGVGTVPRGSARARRSTGTALLFCRCRCVSLPRRLLERWTAALLLCIFELPAGAYPLAHLSPFFSTRLPSVLPSVSHAWWAATPGAVVKLTHVEKVHRPTCI